MTKPRKVRDCYECKNDNHVDCVRWKKKSKKKCGCKKCFSSKYAKIHGPLPEKI